MCMMEKPMHMGMGKGMGMRHMAMMHHGGEGEGGFPLIGDRMPKMEVKTTQGMMTLPDAYAGKWFVLFSHPADFTPVCTTEFV
ncbi:MAG TPA: redoxin domain-containing protein, partial [Methanothrix sp.]|nr:redoxin domain-containing protein [Methanothrix sp.]